MTSGGGAGRTQPRLALKPLLRPSEDVVSLVQRVALQRNQPFERMASRLGLTHPFRLIPKESQVVGLERLFGAQPGAIADWALCAAGHGKATYRGEGFQAGAFVRPSGHLCPVCVAEDRSSAHLEDDPDLRPWLRSHWALHYFSACERHGVLLVPHCHCGEPFGAGVRSWDTCRKGHRAESIEPARADPRELAASRYLHDRLLRTGSDVDRGTPVLDRMGWPHAVRTMLRIGLFKMHGRHPPDVTGNIPNGRTKAIAVGFDELRRFPQSFEGLLDELSAPELREAGGPAGTYGQRFYTYMMQQGADHLEDLRVVFERHAGRAPVKDGTSSMGKAQKVRDERLSESEWVRLRSLVPVDGRSRLTKAEAVRLCRTADAVVQTKGVCEMLGTTRHIFRALLVADALRPAWEDRDATRHWFYRSDVRGLLARLEAAAAPAPSLPRDATTLDRIHHHKVPIIGVVEALLAGRLTASRIEGESGLAAFFFSREQSKLLWTACAAGEDVVDVKLVKHEQKIAQNLMLAVTAGELLDARRFSARFVVDAKDAEAFAASYVSTSKLADEVRCTPKLVTRRLQAWGVEPAIQTDDGQLFRRSDVEPHVAALIAEGDARRRKVGNQAVGQPRAWKARPGVQLSE